MLKKIALATIFAAVSVVSFPSSASSSAANATVKVAQSQSVALPPLGGPVMQGFACLGCR